MLQSWELKWGVTLRLNRLTDILVVPECLVLCRVVQQLRSHSLDGSGGPPFIVIIKLLHRFLGTPSGPAMPLTVNCFFILRLNCSYLSPIMFSLRCPALFLSPLIPIPIASPKPHSKALL